MIKIYSYYVIIMQWFSKYAFCWLKNSKSMAQNSSKIVEVSTEISQMLIHFPSFDQVTLWLNHYFVSYLHKPCIICYPFTPLTTSQTWYFGHK